MHCSGPNEPYTLKSETGATLLLIESQELTADARFTAETVVSIAGAAFGEYCNQQLKTRWLLISDPVGRQATIRSPNNRVTGWPFSIVRKRIHAGESGFFAPVYKSLRRSVEETYAD